MASAPADGAWSLFGLERKADDAVSNARYTID